MSLIVRFREKEPAGVYSFLCAEEADREYGRNQRTSSRTEKNRQQSKPDSKAMQ